jgi:hypothetical protein
MRREEIVNGVGLNEKKIIKTSLRLGKSYKTYFYLFLLLSYKLECFHRQYLHPNLGS